MKECIVIGMNGSDIGSDGTVRDLECKAYYISQKNGYEPKHIEVLDNDLTLLKSGNLPRLLDILDGLLLTDAEREAATRWFGHGWAVRPWRVGAEDGRL